MGSIFRFFITVKVLLDANKVWQLFNNNSTHTRLNTYIFHTISVCLVFIVPPFCISISLVTCPQCQVITKQLHDESRILVRFFVKGVKLGNSIIESLLGDLARSVGGVKDLVVKDGEVKGKTKTDGVCWWKVGSSNSTGCLVGVKGSSGGFLSGVSGLELREVSVL